jgi:DNA polymerase III delta subunit
MTGRPDRPLSPLLYVWGDDELIAERLVGRFADAMAEAAGGPLERWDLRSQLATATADAAQLYERLATPAMFGGGTLAVVTEPGSLVRRNDARDRVVEAIGLIANGNALAVVESARPGAKGPAVRRLADAVAAAGGQVRGAAGPRPTALAAWIADEARDRGLRLATGSARELADRLGARVTEGDVDRRFLSRVAAGELDKLALRHAVDGGAITPEDVRALVAETAPSSLWAITDAIAERRAEAASAALDHALETTPEPIILAIIHRRLVELIGLADRLAAGATLPEAARAIGVTNEFRAKTLAGQARRWTVDELADALTGLLELDAMVKGVAGSELDPAQRRLAFLLWVGDHATSSGRAPVAMGPGRRVGPG